MLRRTVPVLLAALVSVPGILSAQYFGRNKVQYTDFDFKVIQTEHFDVYYYDRERTAALDAARIAERSYGRLSKVLNHEFRERKLTKGKIDPAFYKNGTWTKSHPSSHCCNRTCRSRVRR